MSALAVLKQDGVDGAEKYIHRPGNLIEAKTNASALRAEVNQEGAIKTKDAMLSAVEQFKGIVAQIPPVFADTRKYLLDAIEGYKQYRIDTLDLTPQIESIRINEEKLQQKKREKEKKAEELATKLREFDEEIEQLEQEAGELKKQYDGIKTIHDDLAAGRVAFRKRLIGLIPGAKKRKLAKLRKEGSDRFDRRTGLVEKIDAKKLEKRTYEDATKVSIERLSEEITSLEMEIAQLQKTLKDLTRDARADLQGWVRNLNTEIENCEQGKGLNAVDLTTINTKARATGCMAAHSQENGEYATKLDEIKTRNTINKLRHVTEDPGKNNQTTYKYLKETEKLEGPALFYTGQIIESQNDTVSEDFYGCALVEVFSPESSKHVAFHLPQKTEGRFTSNETMSFLPYTPGFFYSHLTQFLEEEGCDFKDLQIKIISGIVVPTDQIAASFQALGCEESKILVVQLPVCHFNTLTLADKRKILISGQKVEFVEGEPTPGRTQYVMGGSENSGEYYEEVPESTTNFVV